MLYYFTYTLQKKTNVKVCYTLREAETFFDILISANAEYIKVTTFKRRRPNGKI